ncbi:MAG: hypothetical protein AB7P00_26805, partial [Sandaracinaceae bacterium]
MPRRLVLASLLALSCSTGCECEPPPTCPEGGCPVDASIRDAAGPVTDAGGVDAGEPMCPRDRVCADVCCALGELCYAGAECIPDLGPCTIDDDCASDAYCAAEGICVPYGVPMDHVRNESCVQEIDIEAITPALQCAFVTPPPGDPYPMSDQLHGTPVVVDFDFDDDPTTLRPSIVFQSTGGPEGEVLRVIDGATCDLQFNVTTGILDATTPALGDLDGDGRAEILVHDTGGTLSAHRFDGTSFARLWVSSTCDASGARTDHAGGNGQGSSASIHDLDDDGSPEVIFGGSVYGADGCLRASLGVDAFDLMPVVADVDEDGEPEIVSSRGVFRFDGASGTIVPESYYAGTVSTTRFAFTAVGDFGTFPVAAMGGADRAEIVTVAEGSVYVETIEGTRILTGSLPSGRGGPPTIADFDGDGRAELAMAARLEYVVFDFDCLAGGDPMGCGGTSRSDGRLWAVATNEQSSGVTGSSVFDFDADGQAEVIYHDECFLRIFDGRDGSVRYSYPRSSLTWFEMPIVVDADGDFHSEIVLGAHAYSGSCPSTDPYLPAVSFMPTHGVFVLR